MRYIDLEYDADSRRLQLTTDLAGTSVDDRSTVFRMGDWESYPDADLDIVYGVIVRRPDTVVGYTFSRLENGETPVPQDVLRACVGGNLPVSLRITYHSDGRIESSLPLVLSVASIPDPVESVHGTGDLVMTRQSGWEWMPALTYSKGAVAVWDFQIWMSRTDGNLGNEPGKTEEWIELTPYIANLFRYKGNVTNAELDSVTPREMGDTYNITDEGRFPKGCNVTWSGTDWDNLSVHVDTELDASSTNPVQNRVVTDELAKKQGNLTFDTVPTTSSTNPVTSDGIRTAIDTAIDGLGSASKKNAGTGAGQVLLLDSKGKIPTGVYDAYPISEYKGTVATKTALTTLSGVQQGDFAIVSGTSDAGTYICNGDASEEASWVRISMPFVGWGNVTGTLSNQTDLQNALAGKQDTVSQGDGISIVGTKISVADSGVTAGSYGSTTSVPKITVDKMGRVTALAGQTIYPPTTAGTANQYWKSDGSGPGIWQTPASAAASGSAVLVSAGGLATELAKKQATIVKRTVAIAQSAWNSSTLQASVAVSGVTASNTVLVGADTASQTAFNDSGVRAIAQGTNTVTLTCDAVPTADLTVIVIIIP